MSVIFTSVLDVWLVWAGAVLLLTLCCRRVFGRFRRGSFRRFHACEEGASYALPYVLTFPIFVILMAVFMQASLILLCKIGTVYSAYSSARAYLVWQSAAQQFSVGGVPVDLPKFKATRAACLAMVPFASSNPRHLREFYPAFPVLPADNGGSSVASSMAVCTLARIDRPLYWRMYNGLLNEASRLDVVPVHNVITNRKQRAHQAYIENKFKFAAASTRVTLPEPLVAWNKPVTVQVRYRMPFHIPGTARILGASSFRPSGLFGPRFFYRDIESTVSLPSEAAKTSTGKIGIPYQPALIQELVN